MNTLNKALIVLVFVMAVASASIISALHAQRVDWHDKFVKEVNQHYYSIQVLRAETEAREIQVRNLEKLIEIKDDRIAELESAVDAKEGNLVHVKDQLTDLSAKFAQTLEHTEALNRQLGHLIAMQTELQNQNEELRRQRDEAVVAGQQVQAQLYDLQGRYETVMRDLDEAETRYVEAARELSRLRGE